MTTEERLAEIRARYTIDYRIATHKDEIAQRDILALLELVDQLQVKQANDGRHIDSLHAAAGRLQEQVRALTEAVDEMSA